MNAQQRGRFYRFCFFGRTISSRARNIYMSVARCCCPSAMYILSSAGPAALEPRRVLSLRGCWETREKRVPKRESFYDAVVTWMYVASEQKKEGHVRISASTLPLSACVVVRESIASNLCMYASIHGLRGCARCLVVPPLSHPPTLRVSSLFFLLCSGTDLFLFRVFVPFLLVATRD